MEDVAGATWDAEEEQSVSAEVNVGPYTPLPVLQGNRASKKFSLIAHVKLQLYNYK